MDESKKYTEKEAHVICDEFANNLVDGIDCVPVEFLELCNLNDLHLERQPHSCF